MAGTEEGLGRGGLLGVQKEKVCAAEMNFHQKKSLFQLKEQCVKCVRNDFFFVFRGHTTVIPM